MPENEVLSEVLNNIISEARSLRFSGSLPPLESSPSEVLSCLQEARQKLDRVDELLMKVTRIKARSQRAKSVADALSEEAWDMSNQKQRSSGVQRGGDFLGPRERYADANLATLNERRAAREASDLVSLASEAYDCVWIVHRGLDGLRQDILSMLRTLSFESTLERTT